MSYENERLKKGKSNSHYKLYNNRINVTSNNDSIRNLDSFNCNQQYTQRNNFDNYNNNLNKKLRINRNYLNLNHYDLSDNLNKYTYINRGRNSSMKVKEIKDNNSINTIDNIDEYIEESDSISQNDNEKINYYKKKVKVLEYEKNELKKELRMVVLKLNNKNNKMNKLLNEYKLLKNKYFLILENYKLMDIASLLKDYTINRNNFKNNLKLNNIKSIDKKYNTQNNFYKINFLSSRNNILSEEENKNINNMVTNSSLFKKMEMNYKKCLNQNKNILNNYNKIKNENNKYISEKKKYINKINILSEKINEINKLLLEKDEEIKKTKNVSGNNKSKDKKN